MRGTLLRRYDGPCHQGIIPACAGNTRANCCARTRTGDHPRVCGEHGCVNAASCTLAGSSPRVRGTLDCPLTMPSTGGIIPACAGNTLEAARRACGERDHPRVCGEHFGTSGVPYCAMGSSPRVRGTLAALTARNDAAGIIPACAGNTTSTAHIAAATRDHPRVCGEHSFTCSNISLISGSSPRVRGTLS